MVYEQTYKEEEYSEAEMSAVWGWGGESLTILIKQLNDTQSAASADTAGSGSCTA